MLVLQIQFFRIKSLDNFWSFDHFSIFSLSVLTCVRAKSLQSCPTLCDPLDCTDHQAPLSMGFSRQEYWSGFPCPPLRELPDPGIEPASLVSPELAGEFFTTSGTWEALGSNYLLTIAKKIVCPEYKCFLDHWEVLLKSKSNPNLKWYECLDLFLHCTSQFAFIRESPV